MTPLLTRATLVTPNRAEAEQITGRAIASPDQMRAAAGELLALGVRAILIKGGHLFLGQSDHPTADDVLFRGAEETVFSLPRIVGPSPRGTGCALATGIAASLARGASLTDAIWAAKKQLHQRMARAEREGGQWHLP